MGLVFVIVVMIGFLGLLGCYDCCWDGVVFNEVLCGVDVF